MLFAENADVDTVYWPTAVIPVARAPLNADCSWVMNAVYVSKLSMVNEVEWPIENTISEPVVLGAIVRPADKPTMSTICDPIWI